jgi:hypothetical protein
MAAGESDAEFAVRANNTYAELERRLAQEAGVTAVTFAEQLPGMWRCVGEFDSAADLNRFDPNHGPRRSPRSRRFRSPDRGRTGLNWAIFGRRAKQIVKRSRGVS